MISKELARTAFGILGNIISIIMFLSTVPTFYGMWKKGSVGQYSPVPYLATFVSCGLWVLYGLPMVHPHSILVITVNGSGFLIELVYLLIFLMYSNRKKRLRVLMILVAEIVFLGLVALVVLTLIHTTKLRSTVVGSICIVGNVLMYASPLTVMKQVITTKSVEYMPFFLSLFCFANGLAWFCYAFTGSDPFIAVPNGTGAFLGMIQLGLYAAFYKSTQQQIAARQTKGEMGLAEMTTSSADSKKMSNI